MANWDKRAENRLQSTHMLRVAGIPFTELNNGAHLQIGKIDFWPGTGLYKDGSLEGRGIENLIQHIKDKKKEETSFAMTNRQHECPCCGAKLTLTITKEIS